MNNTDSPYGSLTSMSENMDCGLFTNAKGELLIIHAQQTEIQAQWVEYDEDDNSLIIIDNNGHSIPLGLQIDAKTRANLSHGTAITIARIKDQEIKSAQETVFIIRSL